MPVNTASVNGAENLAELVEQLGNIPLHRIRMQPPPGTATEDDLIALAESVDKRLCELVDGILVEKDMGMIESILAAIILQHINTFLDEKDLGLASGADGAIRSIVGRVRVPDISVFTWSTLSGHDYLKQKIFDIVPDLAIEMVSEGNTRKEIDEKLHEYFEKGVKQVWVVYPKTKSARVYSSADKYKRIAPTQALTGGRIMPGFRLPLAKLFERLEKRTKRTKKNDR